ncbi:ABC transporter substrate-binding protein [Arthrobacter sp. D1-29]
MTLKLKVVVPVMAAALVLTGCAQGGAATPAKEAGNSVFRYGGHAVNNLDPHKNAQFTDCTYLCPAYDRLVHVDPDGSLIPGLAESWEFSEGGLKLTFKIREGVKFKDGTVLDGEAVKASLLRARDLPGSAVKNDFATMSDVTVDNPQTVTLNLSAPNAAMPAILSGLAGVVINPTALAQGVNLSETLDGAGAFRFVSYTTGSELKLERNPDYWGETPEFAGIDFRFFTDAAALANSVLGGQIDAAAIVPQNLKPFVDNDKFKMETTSSLTQNTMIVNHKQNGLDDERVRKAILHGLDRDAICEAVYDGFCEITDQPFPPGHYAHNDSIPEVLYPYDQKKAKELLAEAGASDLILKAIMVPAARKMAEVVQAQLKEIGVDLQLEAIELSTMVQRLLIDKTDSMLVLPFSGRIDPSQMLAARHSEKGFFNPGGYTTPKMQQLYVDSVAELDPEARTKILKEASRVAAEAALPLTLSFSEKIYVMRSGVTFPLFSTGSQEITWATETK